MDNLSGVGAIVFAGVTGTGVDEQLLQVLRHCSYTSVPGIHSRSILGSRRPTHSQSCSPLSPSLNRKVSESEHKSEVGSTTGEAVDCGIETGTGVVGLDGALEGVLAVGEDGGVVGFTIDSISQQI